MTRADCPRCHGDGEVIGNPAYPDPQGETSELCRRCKGTGYRDLDHYDRDQDEWAEKGPYSDFPRARRLTPSSPRSSSTAHIGAPIAPLSSPQLGAASVASSIGDLPSAV